MSSEKSIIWIMITARYFSNSSKINHSKHSNSKILKLNLCIIQDTRTIFCLINITAIVRIIWDTFTDIKHSFTFKSNENFNNSQQSSEYSSSEAMYGTLQPGILGPFLGSFKLNLTNIVTSKTNCWTLVLWIKLLSFLPNASIRMPDITALGHAIGAIENPTRQLSNQYEENRAPTNRAHYMEAGIPCSRLCSSHQSPADTIAELLLLLFMQPPVNGIVDCVAF